ncbi:MAG: mechanosensitive ion channel protein MscS [Cyclobacteriaceae bacterium]|nr:MAG: mechanosensitive ion channel protein MscS [Cyclobacteriaceae bacterium]
MDRIQTFLQDPTIIKLLYVLLALVLIWVGIKVINRGIGKYISDNSTRYQARKMASFTGYILFFLAVMLIFNYKLSSLTLALGVAGAGIAFALQEVIVSIAGFLAILSGNFYKVGDRVQLGGIKGDVVDIGVLRTTLMELGDWVAGDLYNGKMVRIANSFVFKEPVFNYSGDFPFLWDELKIPVKTECDYKYCKEVFLKILEEEVGEFADHSKLSWEKLTQQLYVEKAKVDPMVTLTFDENWITFTFRYVVSFNTRRGTKDRIFSRVLDAVAESSGKIKIASAAVEITAFPEKTIL